MKPVARPAVMARRRSERLISMEMKTLGGKTLGLRKSQGLKTSLGRKSLGLNVQGPGVLD